MNESGYADPDIAHLYELLNEWAESDDFYLEWVMDAEAVLDVGCGTGLILRTARERGHPGRLVGVDPAAAMLDVARSHRTDIEWVNGYVQDFSFEAEFDLVFMSGHAFQEWVSDEELRTSLTAIRDALTENGRFVFETRNPELRPWESWTPENAVEIAHPDGGVIWDQNDVQLPVRGDVVTFVSRTTSPDFEGTKEVTCTLRFLGRELLSVFLEEAGLEIEAQYGNWDLTPLTRLSPEIITVVRRR